MWEDLYKTNKNKWTGTALPTTLEYILLNDPKCDLRDIIPVAM